MEIYTSSHSSKILNEEAKIVNNATVCSAVSIFGYINYLHTVPNWHSSKTVIKHSTVVFCFIPRTARHSEKALTAGAQKRRKRKKVVRKWDMVSRLMMTLILMMASRSSSSANSNF
jgi:hypothetical protein